MDHLKILKQKRQAGGDFLDLCHLVFRKQFGHQILPCQRGVWCFQKSVHLGPASQNPFLKGGEGRIESSAGVLGRSHWEVNRLRQDE